MDFATLAVFAGVLTVAAASPGPAVVAIVARTLARGRAGSGAFIAALAFGDILWLAAACLGLAALAATMGSLFVVVRLAGAAYLLYLAYRLWTAPPAPQRAEAPVRDRGPLGLFGAGLAVSMGNPKTMAFYLALLPTLVDLTRLTMLGFVEMSAIIAVVLTVVFAGYVRVADRARRLFASSRAMRWLNRSCGVAMAGAAAAVATK
ncbi:LysE family translocator [Aquabacter spiritensis]|uniref:Threonine/homoserine/homoserine lactone efflux protein n=1 Tax=Aquabacter spiritensis TaxID=933073 RepID=A0A4V2UXE3_9HYPH|nr:LysE family translocator [Aquabacter spiritensis]TCT03168.1 threonine/homoserine/homoserine lactone efflux protein [Aquabacter spiritensis]